MIALGSVVSLFDVNKRVGVWLYVTPVKCIPLTQNNGTWCLSIHPAGNICGDIAGSKAVQGSTPPWWL